MYVDSVVAEFVFVLHGHEGFVGVDVQDDCAPASWRLIFFVVELEDDVV